ncbi:zinc finger C3HC-type protein 1 isoform 3-T3 [Rhynchocyon petersi]
MAAPAEGPTLVAGLEKSWGAVRSPEGTPQKVRQLIDEGIAPEEGSADAKDTSATVQSVNGSPEAEQPPLESTSKEAFFSRVETFSISFSSLKWAGKPLELSPLVCAKYGWVTVECDMLKCSSCQAFLCASLQLVCDFDRYKERCAELRKALCTAHEKFCFWPDSPSPDRFGMLPLDEPTVLLNDVLDRFQSLCHLDLQLPSLRPEDLKAMCLTEDKISLLLHLLEEELEHRTSERKSTTKLGSDIQVHITACILSVCGWACSSALVPMQLSLMMCSQCVRKVGLWGFQQLESSVTDLDSSFGLSSSPIPGPEGRPERFLLVPESPRRMMTRSQDSTCSPGSEQDASSRNFFDPISQHRDWCPWVNATVCKETREEGGVDGSEPGEPGWKAVLNTLLAHTQSKQPAEADSMSLSEKSRKVFRIFRQWESLCSS